jgi:hypothetical protein
MRYKFIILFLLIGFVSKAQVYQIMPQYGYTTFRMNFDSTIQIPTFCGVPKLGSNVTKKGALAFDSCNNRFYYYNPKLQVWDTIKSADASLFVKYTDTAQMLSGYLRKADTIFLSNRIDQRVKYTDTSAMLAPYFEAIDTVNLRRVTSVGLTMPSAFTVTNSPITTSGTIGVTGAGTASQYVRGDGQLANFPTNGGGGSSVNYYLNGSVNQGTFGGTTYYQLSKVPIIGAGTNFTRTNGAGNGYIASFITDAGDPSLLNIPAGNWNLEFYFQSSASGGSPEFYGEIYKVSASNVFTLVASGSANPEGITNGTTVDQYFTSISVPQTSLLITDRLAVRVYVITGGRTITMHTEDNNLCEVLTTFSTGLNALNGLTAQIQYFATGTSGTDFNISSATDTHTFNLPTASATNRGALSSANWTTFNGKVSPSDTANKWITNVFRKTASDSVFFVRGGSNNFAFRDSAGGTNIYNANGSLTGARTLTLSSQPLTFLGGTDATSTRIHGNGNVTIGGTTSPNTDSAYKFTVSGTGNVMKIRMRQGFTFQDINFTQNDVYNLISTGGVFQIGSTATIASFGAGTGGTTFIGCNAQDVVTRVTIGNASWQPVNASSMLDINSTTRGFLQPRLTTTQMNAISTPATGLSVFNTTDSAVYIRRGTSSGWQQVANEIFASATLDFPNTLAQTSSDLTITLTGAVDGDAVVLGVPNAAVNGNSNYFAWISAANTITVRFNNYSSLAINPASATFKVTIIK